MAKLNFSIITTVFSVTWSFRNHSIILIFCSRNISYYRFWKLWRLIFLFIIHFRIPWWIESSKEQHLFKMVNLLQPQTSSVHDLKKTWFGVLWPFKCKPSGFCGFSC